MKERIGETEKNGIKRKDGMKGMKSTTNSEGKNRGNREKRNKNGGRME